MEVRETMSYPNQTLLVTADWLQAHLEDEGLVVLDIRAGQSPLAYRARHIPGARPFSLPHAKSLVGGTPDCLDIEAMATQLGALGLDPEQRVVLYDDRFSTTLTQSFWAFERIGQRSVHLLDGGFEAWCDCGAPTSTELPHPSARRYAAPPRDDCCATADWIEQHAGELQLVDARGTQEFLAGHIRGALSCNWQRLATGESAMPLPAEEAAATLSALGCSPERETVTYCRSGARASFVYYILRLLDWPAVRNYDGSMNDWLLGEREVEKGAAPG